MVNSFYWINDLENVACRCWALYFEAVFFFLSFHCSAPNNKSSIVSSNCHFLHRLPFTLTLDTLFLASSHQCWCEFTGESKGWESQWGNKLLLLCCLPEGRSAFYWWTSSWAQKSVRSLRKDTQYTHKHTCKHTFVHKRTHKMENTIVETVEIHTDRIMHKYTSLVVYSHIVFFHPAVFFFFIQCDLFTASQQITCADHDVGCARTTVNPN